MWAEDCVTYRRLTEEFCCRFVGLAGSEGNESGHHLLVVATCCNVIWGAAELVSFAGTGLNAQRPSTLKSTGFPQ